LIWKGIPSPASPVSGDLSAVKTGAFQFFGLPCVVPRAAALDGGWRRRPEGGWRSLVLAGLLGRVDGEELAEVLSRRSGALALSMSVLFMSPWLFFSAPDPAQMVLGLTDLHPCEAFRWFSGGNPWLASSATSATTTSVAVLLLEGRMRLPYLSLPLHPG
jgi:hypothetical protein